MNRKMSFVLTTLCFLLYAFPVMAGEWVEAEEDQWQYIQEDGTLATGWIEVDDERYYLDANGNRKCDYWLRDKENGYWYYLDEDGAMAANTWVDNYYVDETGRFEKKR